MENFEVNVYEISLRLIQGLQSGFEDHTRLLFLYLVVVFTVVVVNYSQVLVLMD